MNISLAYKERFETSYKHLVDELRSEFGYNVLELAKVLRHHLSNKTKLGIECSKIMDSGYSLNDELFHELIKGELDQMNGQNVLIRDYPKSKGQIELLKNYCQLNGHQIKHVWYLKGTNTYNNIAANKKYSMIVEKYESKEYAVEQILYTRKRIAEYLGDLNMNEKLITFESEALGVNFQKDKLRIRETIHNML